MRVIKIAAAAFGLVLMLAPTKEASAVTACEGTYGYCVNDEVQCVDLCMDMGCNNIETQPGGFYCPGQMRCFCKNIS